MVEIWDILENPFGEWKLLVTEIEWKSITCISLKYWVEKQPKEETIYVPDNIKIEMSCGVGWDDLCINNGRQSLWYFDDMYAVHKSYKQDEVKCKLIPIDVKDLEVGGTYYRHDNGLCKPNYDSLPWYCKYLWKSKHVYWDGEWVSLSIAKYDRRYKVVPIN